MPPDIESLVRSWIPREQGSESTPSPPRSVSLSWLNRQLKERDYHPRLVCEVAFSLNRLGYTSEALLLIGQGLSVSPLSLELLSCKGYILASKGDLVGAEVQFSAIIEFDPSHWEARLARAEVRRMQWKLLCSYRDYTRVLQSFGSHPIALFGRSYCRVMLSQQTCESGLVGQFDWNDPRGLVDDLRSLVDLGEYDLVDRLIKDSFLSQESDEHQLNLPDGGVDLLLIRGRVGLAREELNEAMEFFNRVLIFDDSVVEAYSGRGEILFRLGCFSDSLAEYSTAVSLSPSDPKLRFRRGQALEKTGEIQAAKLEFQAAVNLEGDNQDYLEQFERLELVGN